MNMNTKTTRLAAVLWVWSVMLATWVWAYAAKQAPALTWDLNNQNQERVMRHPFGSWDFRPEFWSWEFMPPFNWTWKQEKMKDDMMKWWRWGWFVFAFLDEDSLTDEQKTEIENLQTERDEAIKKINDDFFDKLEKYISEEKLDDYEQFVEKQVDKAWMGRWKWRWGHMMHPDSSMKDIQKPVKEEE